MATVQERIKQAKEKIEHVRMGGGEKAIEKQHSKGKLTAHERLDLLFDEGTFVELDALLAAAHADMIELVLHEFDFFLNSSHALPPNGSN